MWPPKLVLTVALSVDDAVNDNSSNELASMLIDGLCTANSRQVLDAAIAASAKLISSVDTYAAQCQQLAECATRSHVKASSAPWHSTHQ
jgi:hypothetical protein